MLLQVCANDHPPFTDICLFHAAAARSLGWRTVSVMLQSRGRSLHPAFVYAREDFPGALARALGGREPLLTLCHRYRAYRAVMSGGVVEGPVVAVAHEFGMLRHRRRRWRRHWDRLRRRPQVRFAGVSDAVADELAAAAGEAVLLPNGIDLARADERRLPREQALAALRLSPDAFNVAVVGRLHPKKNPELAVAGLSRVAGSMPDIELVFVGDGELAARLEAQARGLPVRMAGFVPDAARLMAAFDLLLMPSGEREAFGMVALEAMAAGVPVLCGPAPGPRFVVGDTGRTFAHAHPDEVGSALLSAHAAWRSGDLVSQARRARQRVEREFSVAAAAGRLEALAVTQ